MSTETKAVQHTPGPWRVCEDGLVVITSNSGPDYFPSPLCPSDDIAELRANARLIAAAPELLLSCMELREACAACFRVISRRSETADEMEAEFKRIGLIEAFGVRAQDAITKATGKEKPTLAQFELYDRKAKGEL